MKLHAYIGQIMIVNIIIPILAFALYLNNTTAYMNKNQYFHLSFALNESYLGSVNKHRCGFQASTLDGNNRTYILTMDN